MSKVFNAYEKATIKNTAKEVARLAARQEKLREQAAATVKKLEEEIKEIDETINQYEENVQKITGGYAASELCEKVARGSQNDWVFKYPDTIVPPQITETKVEQNENPYGEEVTLKDISETQEVPTNQEGEDENEDEINPFEAGNGNNDDPDVFSEEEFN